MGEHDVHVAALSAPVAVDSVSLGVAHPGVGVDLDAQVVAEHGQGRVSEREGGIEDNRGGEGRLGT